VGEPVTVGARELRQNLSASCGAWRPVSASRSGDNRREVAVPAPVPEPDDWFERLISERTMTRPVGDLLDIVPLPPVPEGSMTLSEALEEGRRRDREREGIE
jgi:hypothetical protein